MQVRIKEIEATPGYIKEVVHDGCAKARRVAEETMRDVRNAMGLARV